MAKYTMTIYEMVKNPLIEIFPKDYPFYVDDEDVKKEFEETFILHYLTNEIAYETPYVFQQKLLGTFKLIMPYYQQLYLTEWTRVGKDMMNQKELTDTVTHTLTSTTDNNSNINESLSSEVSSTANETQSSQSSTEQNHQESMLADGVSSSQLHPEYLTGVSNDTQENNQSINSNGTNEQTSTTTNQSTGQNQSNVILEETTTSISKGDIGIQTPAYAIAEWRKIIININKEIIDECSHLFMKIY